MVPHLGHMMLVQILRRYVNDGANGDLGWLAGFADSRVSAALAAIHAAPARRWMVDELATCCHVSRSTFALHFKRRLGFGPLEYVLRWRIQLAMRALRRSNASISTIAQKLGYDLARSGMRSSASSVARRAPIAMARPMSRAPSVAAPVVTVSVVARNPASAAQALLQLPRLREHFVFDRRRPRTVAANGPRLAALIGRLPHHPKTIVTLI
ncbi:helix-turn-helix domain-containing protein [Burkholderia sp. BCC0405]|uniref:helix-turn-helix domain-containing protein n=1 Tax=Burkholderia sp. BCC0405 TaxID=2676298 RepID=UPI001FC85C7F|nr:helix-turn-helix domain-containing protein [Burkholderia sp. BCC0405]